MSSNKYWHFLTWVLDKTNHSAKDKNNKECIYLISPQKNKNKKSNMANHLIHGLQGKKMFLNFSQTNSEFLTTSAKQITNFKPIATSWDEKEVESQTNHKFKNKKDV